MPKMGLGYGLDSRTACAKRKFRWLFRIPEVSAEGIETLPPEKSARPSLTFKEAEAQHLNESIFLPVKTEWKPINLVLYDLKRKKHPVMEWVKKLYNPCTGDWKPFASVDFKRTATLELYKGCGDIIELWQFDNVYPQVTEMGDLDMGNSEVVTADLTIRYDRAYLISEC